VRTIREGLRLYPGIERVRMVCFDEHTLAVYRNALDGTA